MDPRRVLVALLVSSAAFACTASHTDAVDARREAITSIAAEIVDFTFSAEVVAGAQMPARQAVVSQLLYAQGELKRSSRASGQIGNVVLSRVAETVEGDKKRIRYEGSLPVAWPADGKPPSTYALAVPLDVTALESFDAKYDGSCGTSSAQRSEYWHDFDPNADGCALEDRDVARATATVGEHAPTTSAKYPEYDRIWADDRLDVVAIFGIIRDRDANDWGFTEAARFLDGAARSLGDARVRSNRTSDSIVDDKTLTGSTAAGEVRVDVLVVPSIEGAGSDFDARYDALTESADVVLYSGHAGHGRNINALVRKGKVAKGRYQLMLLNGCESFALADTTVTERRRAANGSADPEGTKFVDVVSNAQPGQSNTLATVSRVVYDAALAVDRPQSYAEMIRQMPEQNVVVVYGEEDNTFSP